MHVRKRPRFPPADFAPWATARFQTREIRDRFLSVAALLPTSEVEAMPHECRAALVRWRLGQFLGLNDIAYAHGGRIVLERRRGV